MCVNRSGSEIECFELRSVLHCLLEPRNVVAAHSGPEGGDVELGESLRELREKERRQDKGQQKGFGRGGTSYFRPCAILSCASAIRGGRA